ncbi:cysteine--tRNA ligase [Candidatus Gracilibacteria bacterium]|nr:cysteine--tRNA ligase [Candidatus Gracilibacteria bacterium]MCF7898819.1 cysteine--tRNA ligase [Candidatus Paceibacterota bacterium]
MPQDIKLYNTKSKSVDNFIPIIEKEVGIYSCGPTVYHYAHIGNLRSYVFADILRRTFVYAGYKVNHIINITDVGHMVGDGDDGQDKLEKGAAREGKNVWEVAKMYTDAFMKDIEALNIPTSAYTFPRATDHIREQIGLISALEIEGYAYRISDGIYFDTSKYKKYADFAHLDIEGLRSGARVEENTEKRNITDFALWKLSPADEERQMEWDSPWGKGFPGWHIECSAMSMKYLGETFDIHTGGIDHIPVHHTNEIAQSECATGKTYANYWMHVNFLNDTTGKMSKSNDDFLTLDVLKEKGYSPLAYRYYLLTTHYKSEISFSFDGLDGSIHAYNKLTTWCSSNISSAGKINNEYKNKFEEVIFNDLNTPQAIALIWILLKDEAISDDDKYSTIISFDEILGLNLKNSVKEELVISEEIKVLLEARALARTNSNYQESDRLRDEILSLGYIVKDGKEGQEISVSR